jgi:hypothetical protein
MTFTFVIPKESAVTIEAPVDSCAMTNAGVLFIESIHYNATPDACGMTKAGGRLIAGIHYHARGNDR